MRFGLFIPQGWRLDLAGIDTADQWATMRDLAQYADRGDSWESIWVFDHFHTVPEPTDEATHEAWTLMAAFAASTSRVRMGQMCTCVTYRNPAHMAKVTTTIDVLSGGRAILGIGAAWFEREHNAYGYAFPPLRERFERLEDALRIARAMFTEDEASVEGRHHRVDGLLNRPRPIRGDIPILIGGSGERKTLRLVAQYADACNVFGDVATCADRIRAYFDAGLDVATVALLPTPVPLPPTERADFVSAVAARL